MAADKVRLASIGLGWRGLRRQGLEISGSPDFRSGTFLKAGDHLLGPARKVLAERGLKPNRDDVRVVTAAYGPDAGLIGAACLAFDELEESAGS